MERTALQSKIWYLNLAVVFTSSSILDCKSSQLCGFFYLTICFPFPLFFFLCVTKVIIKDTSLVLTPAHIKAYILMTLQGLEYMHQHWVLHRVTTKYTMYAHEHRFMFAMPVQRKIADTIKCSNANSTSAWFYSQ